MMRFQENTRIAYARLLRIMRYLTNELRKPAPLFVVLALSFGLLNVFLTPPGFNADEPAHTYRALQISQGELLSSPVSASASDAGASGKYGGEVAQGAVALFAKAEITNTLRPPAQHHSRAESIDWHGIAELRYLPAKKVEVAFTNTATYSPLVYLPNVFAVWIGQALRWPMVTIFYAMRILGLFAAVALIWVAIRMAPIGKWSMFVVALLPTTVTQLAAVSADPVTIGLCFLAIALALSAALQDEKPTWSQWILIGMVFGGVSLAKPAYAILLGILVAIPLLNRFARGWRSALSLFTLVGVSGIIAVAWQHTVAAIPPIIDPISKVHEQTAFVLSHPHDLVATLMYTFFTDKGLPRDFFENIFGTALWNNYVLAAPFMFILVAALAVSVFLTAAGQKQFEAAAPVARVVARIGLLVLFALSAAIVALGLYIIWSPLHATTVVGLQGRYFIPFLPLALMACSYPHLLRQRGAKVAVVVVVSGCLLVFAFGVWSFLYQPVLLPTWD